ncbi:MAG: zf-HC2 domain-containing protein [Candidatus Hydrogenedentes bacterium]|nr:zf-HC2 domain-containing protein [Candidatus Hydrogenedentota bacterium]
MNCEHIRTEFSALLDDELNAEDRELVEEHLSECSDCLRELHGYKQVTEAYRYHHPVKAPADFEARVREALRPASRRLPGAFWWRYGLAAASIALVGGLVVWRGAQSGQSALDMARYEAAPSAAAPEAHMANEAMPMAEAPPAAPLSGETLALRSAPAMSDEDVAAFSESAGAAPPPAPAPPASPPAPARAIGREDLAAGATAAETAMASEPLEAESAAADDGARGVGLGGGGGGFGGGGLAGGGFGGGAALGRAAGARAASQPAEEPVAPAGPGAAKESSEAPEAAFQLKMAPPAPDLAEGPADAVAVTVRQWRDREFRLEDGTWREAGYGAEPRTVIAIPSAAWNAMLDRHNDLHHLCDVAEPVIVALDGAWYEFRREDAEGGVEQPLDATEDE